MCQDTEVAILLGEVFQLPPEELNARLAFVNFDGSKPLSMSETIPLNENISKGFADICCFSVIEDVKKIANWVKSLRAEKLKYSLHKSSLKVLGSEVVVK